MEHSAEYLEYLDSPEWQDKRAAKMKDTMRKKKELRCEACSAIWENGRGGEVHHNTYPQRFGDETMADLNLLCGECHRELTKYHDEMMEDPAYRRNPRALLRSTRDFLRYAQEAHAVTSTRLTAGELRAKVMAKAAITGPQKQYIPKTKRRGRGRGGSFVRYRKRRVQVLTPVEPLSQEELDRIQAHNRNVEAARKRKKGSDPTKKRDARKPDTVPCDVRGCTALASAMTGICEQHLAVVRQMGPK